MAKLTKCQKGYPTAQQALRRIKKGVTACVYRCIKCELWHTNHKKHPAIFESYRDHIVGWNMNHERPGSRPVHCTQCDTSKQGRVA